MTPGQIIALIKDVLIVVAVALVFYFVVQYGKDIVKVQDMHAVQKQLANNADTEARWRQEQTDADTKRDAALAQVATTIGQQRAPVYVVPRGPASQCAVPGNPGQASGQPSAAGGSDPGRGSDRQPVDLRPQVNALELKYETALADCYG